MHDMVRRRFYRYLFTLCCLWWTLKPHCGATHSIWKKCETQQGTRYIGDTLTQTPADSLLGCSTRCAHEELCYGAKFGSGQCDLLSAMVCGQPEESG